MTTVTMEPAPDVEAPRPRSTRRDDLLVAVAGTWLLLGLFVDGWAHTNLAELETFFTPWHALFYSGFTATAFAVGRVVQRHRTSGVARSWTTPPGYRLGMVGLVLFAIGGVGDALWHVRYGIEESLDALLSPTHLLLFAGVMLLVTTPLRAGLARAAARPEVPGAGSVTDHAAHRRAVLDRAVPRHDLLPAFLGLLLASLLVSFFLMYAWAPTAGLLGVPYVAGGDELPAAFGVLGFLVTTVLLLAPIAILVVRVDLPVGWATLLLGTIGVLMAGLQAFQDTLAVVPPLLTGVTLDVAAARGWLRPDRPTAWRWSFGLAGAVLAGSQVAVFALTRGVEWPTELWAGAIVFSALTGVGLTLLTVPPAPPPRPGARTP